MVRITTYKVCQKSTKGTTDPEGTRLPYVTVVYVYNKPRLCMNIHHYVPRLTDW